MAARRSGIGRLLPATIAAGLRAVGVSIHPVNTLDPSHLDEGYRDTRTFSQAMGFVALLGGWSDTPCLLMATPAV